MSDRENKCGIPCDGLNCTRARYLRLILENGGDPETLRKSLEPIIKFEERIIREGKCQQPDQLRKEVERFKGGFQEDS